MGISYKNFEMTVNDPLLEVADESIQDIEMNSGKFLESS